MPDLTTLQLAEAIAFAVLATDRDGGNSVQAVMATLREHSAWFCRVSQNADGVIDLATVRQMEMF